MKLLVKLILIMLCIGLSIALCVIIFLKANQQLMGKAEAKSMVEKRYEGKINSINTNDNKSTFLIELKSSEGIYNIQLNREKKTISKIKQTRDFKQQKPKNRKEEQKENKKTSEQAAKDMAQKQVGGSFKSISLVENNGIKNYVITQDINSQKGANIIINQLTGKVSSVAWFNKNSEDALSTTTPPTVNQNPRIYTDNDDDDEYEGYDDYEVDDD